jgi:hypothetical protein
MSLGQSATMRSIIRSLLLQPTSTAVAMMVVKNLMSKLAQKEMPIYMYAFQAHFVDCNAAFSMNSHTTFTHWCTDSAHTHKVQQ